MNQFPSRSQVELLRQTYPPGTRLVLDQMEDGQAVAPGTRGTVAYVDDAGQLGMKWDNGRTLSLIPGVDSFRKLTEQELLEEQSGGTPTDNKAALLFG